MPITGVIPLPAVTNRVRRGQRPRSVKSPAAWSRWISAPGRERADDVVADLAVRDGLDGDRQQAVGRLAHRGERVGAPVADAVHVDADPDVLAGAVPAPGAAGSDPHGGGVRRLSA